MVTWDRDLDRGIDGDDSDLEGNRDIDSDLEGDRDIDSDLDEGIEETELEWCMV